MSKHLLEHWQDVIGQLLDIRHDGDLTYLTFDGLDKEVVLVAPKENVINFLNRMIGERVGVLRTNIPGKEYCYRILEEKQNETTENEPINSAKISDCRSNPKAMEPNKCRSSKRPKPRNGVYVKPWKYVNKTQQSLFQIDGNERDGNL